MKFVFNVSEWLQNLNIFFMYRQKIFCPNAGCQRLCHTSAFKKHLYAPIGLNEYFVKSAPLYIYVNNTLLPALAAREIYRDIFGPPML